MALHTIPGVGPGEVGILLARAACEKPVFCMVSRFVGWMEYNVVRVFGAAGRIWIPDSAALHPGFYVYWQETAQAIALSLEGEGRGEGGKLLSCRAHPPTPSESKAQLSPVSPWRQGKWAMSFAHRATCLGQHCAGGKMGAGKMKAWRGIP